MTEARGFSARPATAGLIALCTAVFVVTCVAALLRADQPLRALGQSVLMLEDQELLDQIGALTAARVWLDGQWWRVLTANLLHGSWLHVGLNMVGLWTVGLWTEKVWGWWRQLLVFLVAGVGGSLASLAWAEAPLVVGASAGIFGVASALVVARIWGTDSVRGALAPVSGKVLGFWLALWLGLGVVLTEVFDISLFANAAHFGGLVFGAIAGLALALPAERRFTRAGLGLVVVAGLAGLGVLASEPSSRPNYHVIVGIELLDRGDFEAAAMHLEHALVDSPDDAVLANAVAYAWAEAGVELERAEELVRGALEVDPESADYLDTLGWIQCQRGLVEEGIATLEAAKEVATREIPELQEHVDACAGVGGR